MSDLPVPKAEAKPSTNDLPPDIWDLASETYDQAWMCGADQQDALKVALLAAAPILIAAGRAQAAADIRAHADDEAQRPGRKSSSHLIETWLREAALIAEGDDDPGTDVDEPSLPASTGGGIHGETPTGGTR